jgi:hypothetical protein
MSAQARDRARFNGSRDPWRDAPSGELGDPLLPRWFVLTAIVAVVVAVVVLALALLSTDREQLPVEARRPPPSPQYTTAVGAAEVGVSSPQPWESTCPVLDGIRLAGADADRAQLRRGLAGLCNVDLPPGAESAVTSLADAGGTVRFATFEATGVDSTARRDEPVVLLNTRFGQTDPLWLAPLVVHDAVMRAGDPRTAETALAAREAELAVCNSLLGTAERSRGCVEAAAITGMDDPLAALRSVGFE